MARLLVLNRADPAKNSSKPLKLNTSIGLKEKNFMNVISPNMVSAIQIQFYGIISEDDFIEKGMKAWLTGIDWCKDSNCYILYLDFSDFEEYNAKYFRRTYYGNRYTGEIEEATGRTLFTAIEARYYESKLAIRFALTSDTRNDKLFEKEIQKYLRITNEFDNWIIER